MSASSNVSSSYASTASYVDSASYASTASYINSASYASTASYVIGASSFPYTGSALITGSLGITGSFKVTGSLEAIGTSMLSSSNGNVVTVVGSGSTPLLKIIGSQGELLNIYDRLSGSIFSANDISGFPQIETFSDGVTILGDYSVRSLYHTLLLTSSVSNTTHSLYSFNTSSYNSAFFEYVAIQSTNARAGTIMGVWSGSNISFTEYTSSNIGNTDGLNLTMVLSQSKAHLILLSPTGSWKVKSIVKSV
jgi:hypothetical protein